MRLTKRVTKHKAHYNINTTNTTNTTNQGNNMLPSSLYSPSDWAELFTLCTQVEETGNQEPVHAWLCEYSKTHDLPQPEETEEWSDTRHVIKEALMFLNKFAENHMDDFYSRKA